MASVFEPKSAGRPISSMSQRVWLIVAWLWVGIPLAWGVYLTIRTSLALFGPRGPGP